MWERMFIHIETTPWLMGYYIAYYVAMALFSIQDLFVSKEQQCMGILLPPMSIQVKKCSCIHAARSL
jgi:hypothetical protein